MLVPVLAALVVLINRSPSPPPSPRSLVRMFPEHMGEYGLSSTPNAADALAAAAQPGV